jgi:hypothetical protein
MGIRDYGNNSKWLNSARHPLDDVLVYNAANGEQSYSEDAHKGSKFLLWIPARSLYDIDGDP